MAGRSQGSAQKQSNCCRENLASGLSDIASTRYTPHKKIGSQKYQTRQHTLLIAAAYLYQAQQFRPEFGCVDPPDILRKLFMHSTGIIDRNKIHYCREHLVIWSYSV